MSSKKKKKYAPQFKSKDFWLFNGVGLGVGGLGVLLFWATYTVPEGGGSESYALSTTQRLARMLPEEAQMRIAAIIAILFVLFGLFLVLISFYKFFKYLIFKR
ncbi:MAG TPA: hypothetical protein PKN32_03750 [Bacteroidales bacterium]|nr:hypothetical protein [Bacteroidales bacterium]